MDLVIDTAHGGGIIGLVEGGKAVAEIVLERDGVAEALQQLIAGRTLDRIVVGVGPGSYTGVRVGMALATGLHISTGVPLVGVCSLCAYVPRDSGPFASVVSAGPGGSYVLEGEKRGDVIDWGEPQQLEAPPERTVVGPDHGVVASILALSNGPAQGGSPRAIYLRGGVRLLRKGQPGYDV